MPVTESQVLETLKAVIDPDLHQDIVKLGFVKDIKIEGESIEFAIELTTPACPVKDILQAQAETAVRSLEGVSNVSITMTSRVRQKQGKPEDLLPNVRHIIAVASGKGGVGKSTTTVNLAVALSQTGAKVGILDADVYGPSIPLLMGAMGEPPLTKDDKILPIERFGIRMMSLGFLMADGDTVMWRGPLVAGTVKQLLSDVDWGDLDYLLVDLPPGTGDAPMSLAQLAPLTGVVIVSTPHNVAANIAGKAVGLFRRLNTPILGVVENMGPAIDPSTGVVSQMFVGQSGSDLAMHLKCPYLGSIPFDPKISESGDMGRPSIVAYPNREQAKAFKDIAGRVAQQASIIAMTREEVPKEAEPVPV